jgi:hypothetical protein
MAVRNAASVLPEPVGARRSVDRPATIGGHPFVCAAVGAAKDASNQRRTAGRKRSRGSGFRVTGAFSPYCHSGERCDEESAVLRSVVTKDLSRLAKRSFASLRTTASLSDPSLR